jgi:type I restriction enzyme, S subunit
MAVWSESTLIDAYMNRRIDSEFFRPAYVHAEEQIRRCRTADLGKLGYFVPGPFGSSFHVKNYDFRSPYRYLRGRDVKPFFLLDDDNRYIPETDFRRLQGYAVEPDDLMISVVGTLGNVAVCTAHDTPAVFSCKSTLFRTFGTPPYFLLAYLNCQQGQFCLLRRQRGAVQTGLNIEDLRTIPVPRFDDEIESVIASNVQLAHQALRESKARYSQAQELLESELGLDKLNFQKPVAYTAQFSELEQSRRLDSEHYYPAFKNLLDHLPSGVKLSPLSFHLSFCQRGKQPSYTKHGLPVINSKHVQPNKVIFEGNRRAAANPNSDLQIRYGDVLVNGTGRGTIGRAAPYLQQSVAVPDNHVTILRSPDLDPVFISFYLNSVAGQLQVEMHQRGISGQLELYPFDIRRFLIWSAPEGLQKELRALHDRATAAERKSKQLLEQAKTRVEQLIDEAVRS